MSEHAPTPHLLHFEENYRLEPDLMGMTETKDHFYIRWAVFKSKAEQTKGTVLLLQGRNEAIEKYLETIADFTERGFDVTTFDWRGQGGSSRFFADARRGHIDSFDQYTADFDLIFSEVALPECRAPFYIVAHSTGSLIALYTAPIMANRIRRMMLGSPFLGITDDLLSEGQISLLAGTASFLGLGSLHMGGSRNGIADIPFEGNRSTTDPIRYARNKVVMNPVNGLGLGSATAGWLNASVKAVQKIRRNEHMAAIQIPILFVNAGADRVVSISAIEDYAGRIRSGALITIDGARHEIMQEADKYRAQFFAAFDAFIPGSSDYM